MPEYWIETDYFAAPVGDFTPEQHACFCKLCRNVEEEFNERFTESEHIIFVFADYTQTWEKHVSNACSENVFWESIKHEEHNFYEHYPNCQTFIKVFPAGAINIDLKGFPTDFIKKRNRFNKTKRQCSSIFQKDTEEKDWDLLNEFLELADTARGNYENPNTQSEQMPVIIDGRFTESIEAPPIFIAASGRGNPQSAVDTTQNTIEWADAPANVNIENPKEISDPFVKAIEKQTKEIQKQTAILENIGESTGRNTAKWLLKADMSQNNKELQEEVLSDLGFEPIETTDKLYPNASKSERRTISQRISKNKNKKK